MKQTIIEYLDGAFGVDGDDANELFTSYVNTITENFAKLQSQSLAGDFADAVKTAHTIKGCSLNCGNNEMAEAANAAEFAAKAGDAETLRLNVEKIREMTEILSQELAG